MPLSLWLKEKITTPTWELIPHKGASRSAGWKSPGGSGPGSCCREQAQAQPEPGGMVAPGWKKSWRKPWLAWWPRGWIPGDTVETRVHNSALMVTTERRCKCPVREQKSRGWGQLGYLMLVDTTHCTISGGADWIFKCWLTQHIVLSLGVYPWLKYGPFSGHRHCLRFFPCPNKSARIILGGSMLSWGCLP